jgi:hypothetical protein
MRSAPLSLTPAVVLALMLGTPQHRWARIERRAGHVTYSVQPGARVLWCLRRRKSDVRCVIYPGAVPVEVRVVQDTELVLTEIFQEEWIALNWAKVYADRLRTQGWYDSPGD